jgi:UDP-N-acetylmuramate dehydrogenase
MKSLASPSLEGLNTFGVPATAGQLIRIEDGRDLEQLPPFDPARDLLLGGGSNVLFASDVPGTVYLNRIPGMRIVGGDDQRPLVEAGAGEDWHRFVRWSLGQGLCGLENLSLIPGRVGAAPMQNIGAYGVELSSVLEQVTAWDWQTSKMTVLSREECRLGYRDSLFRSVLPGRYMVVSVHVRLARAFTPQLTYEGLRSELAARGISNPTAKEVSEAVIRIRRRKLPDPAVLGNAGSFFKNPVVEASLAESLSERYRGLPAWPAPDGGRRLSAAWMIEFCGLKGFREGNAGVSDRHALVLVNYGGATGSEITRLARTVQSTVHGQFGIMLEPEPLIVDFRRS